MTERTRLVIVRPGDDNPPDERHILISVQPEVVYLREHGCDLDNAEQWHEIVLDALDVAGTLARLAVDIAPALGVTARRHGCDWMPYEFGPQPDNEIPRAWSGDGCKTFLWPVEPSALLDEGEMPHLTVTVPRNRERSWRLHLAARLAAISQATVDALS